MLALCAAAPAQAQWRVEAAAGSTEHDPVAASVGTRSLMLGVRHEGPRWGYLSAGAPLDSAGLPWAAAGAGARLGLGHARLQPGVDLFAHGHVYRAPALDLDGAGLVLGALPYLAWSAGPARVEARSGVLHYGTAFGGAREGRLLHDSGVRAVARAGGGLVLGAEGRYVRAEEGDYPFVGASAELRRSRASLWAHGGRWLAELVDGTAWGVGARWEVGARTELSAGLEQEVTDPLYWNDPRRSWSIGLSRSLGPAAEPALALPVVPVAADGRVEIRLPLRESAEPPSVAGDFNQWTPVPMQRRGDAWVVSLELRPGVYQYSFQRADGTWFVPDSEPNRVDDGFGGHNAVLMVTAQGGA